MKIQTLLFMSLFASVSGVWASDLVSDVSARQRWPWSAKVDVSYIYTGENPTSVCFTATWRGQETPVDIVAVDATGTFLVTNGQHRFTWDPVAAGYGNDALVDFRVQAAVTNADPRTYLVVDLVNGGYELLSSVPEGGWTDEHKKTKMVFRRIPAGTYELGFPEQDFYTVTMVKESASTGVIAESGTPRTVTMSSDFYVAVFLTTKAQVAYITGSSSTDMTPAGHSGTYDHFRGQTLEDGRTVDWPTTGYQVTSDSWVGQLRSKVGDGLLADLPTDDQWEIAMRAGTTTFLPNGQPDTYTYETWDPFFKELFWNGATKYSGTTFTKEADPLNTEVGLKAPNSWGLYDYNVRNEAVLDWANDLEALRADKYHQLSFPKGGMDRVGPTNSIHKLRVMRGGSATGPTWCPYNYAITSRYGGSTETSVNCCYRFAIHLKPLVKE